ncbi:MAG: tyrosinase family protein [Bacteroidota bacterium]
MKFASVRLLPLALLGMLLLMSRCAVIPTCPNELLPVVEIQINNTASNHDDYGTVSSFTACRARITNYARFGGGYNFPGGVSVELRNPNSSGNLQYSAIANPVIGTPSVFITLPEDGGWFNFSIKGNTANMVDKAISIEMSTAGSCDEVVLARKALMIAKGDPPISQTAALGRVELEIGSVATLDDYITWSPTSCRIRWSSGTAGSTLPVTLQNMGSTDRIRFADSSLAGGQTAVNAALPLVLNGDGSWVNFYIAGNYQHASVRDKDAVIEVSETASGQILSREGLMVRIRKNANTLTANERNRYLEALKKMDLTYNDYIDFVKTHSRDNTGSGGSLIAHKQALGGSGFLPWHRVFVMHLERILQAADPAVSVPYWKFDDNAPAIFTPNYFGSNSGGNFATLSATNPIVSWTLPGEGVSTGIQRNTPYG